MNLHSVVIGCGSYLPEKILRNDDLATMVDTTDAWITERTGIKQRHIAAEGEMASDMAFEAAKKAIEAAGLQHHDIELIVLATTTPDNTFPSTATKLQAMLGINGNAAAFDVQAVCAGFIYALSIADKYIKSGEYKNVLVVGTEVMSRIVDWEDRSTCILFGDGAGAVVLQAREQVERGILSTHLHSDGNFRDILYANGGAGSNGHSGKIFMAGKDVFKHAVTKLIDCTQESLAANNLSADALDWIIPHQANIRIIDSVIKKLGVPHEKLIATVDKHANTSAASIPLAICEAIDNGQLQQGNLVSLQAIGGGLSWGSCLIRW